MIRLTFFILFICTISAKRVVNDEQTGNWPPVRRPSCSIVDPTTPGPDCPQEENTNQVDEEGLVVNVYVPANITNKIILNVHYEGNSNSELTETQLIMMKKNGINDVTMLVRCQIGQFKAQFQSSESSGDGTSQERPQALQSTEESGGGMSQATLSREGTGESSGGSMDQIKSQRFYFSEGSGEGMKRMKSQAYQARKASGAGMDEEYKF